MTTSIFITGANQGLGYELARQLSKHENLFIIIGGRNEAALKEAAQKITSEQGSKSKVDWAVIDISNDESILAAAKSVETKLNGAGLDVLVNNAAIAIDHAGNPPVTEQRALMLKTYDTNVFGTVVTTEAFLPLIKKGKDPRIVFVGSSVGSIALLAAPGSYYHRYGYNTSKAAMHATAVVTAGQNKDVHVTVLNPGYVATNLNGYGGAQRPEDAVKFFLDYVLQRKGKSPGFYEAAGELPW